MQYEKLFTFSLNVVYVFILKAPCGHDKFSERVVNHFVNLYIGSSATEAIEHTVLLGVCVFANSYIFGP